MVVARLGSPLLVGVGEREMFVASDLAALVRYTTSVVHLADGELASVSATDVRTYRPDVRTGRLDPTESTATEVDSPPEVADLAEGGSVWVLTPKVGREGYVQSADIAEAAPVAGLSTTTTSSASDGWSATRLSTHKR